MAKTQAEVGAGPVGMLTAIRLGQAGIKTILCEAHESLLPTTRACIYMPVVNQALEQLNILDVIIKNAYVDRRGISWRDLQGNLLANLRTEAVAQGSFTGTICLGQWKLADILLQQLSAYPCVEVRFGLKCVDIESRTADGRHAIVTVAPRNNPDLKSTIEAQYVLATDGSKSAVRELLGIPFEGFTYEDWKMIGTDVIFDFVKEVNFTPLNFIVHPEYWAVVVYTGQDGKEGGLPGTSTAMYRIAYVENPNLSATPEDYLERAKERVKLYTCGKQNFEVIRAEPYVNQQRVAAKAKEGRVMLAGDALHSNNPIGALGLSGGVLDAQAYGNALVRVLRGGESEQVLDDCGEARRRTWIEVTNPLSQENLDRLRAVDENGMSEVVKARERYFEGLNKDETFMGKVRAKLATMIDPAFV